MATVTITTPYGTNVHTYPNLGRAETFVNLCVEEFLTYGSKLGDKVTGGKLGDWRNVTLYLNGDASQKVTIVTSR